MSRRSQKAEDQLIETAIIRDLTADGRGVTEIDGKAIFVDAAIRGERVSFRRQKKRKKYDEAELIEVIETSPDRVEPPCKYFSVCGGCSLQHLNPLAQLSTKQDALMQSLERIGGLVPDKILPALAGQPLGYRRRARMGAKLVDKKGRVLVGFREKRKPYIADMYSCETLEPQLGALIQPLSGLIESLSISRQLPQIEMSLGDTAMSLVFRVLATPSAHDRVLLEAFANHFNADIWLQTGGPNTVVPLLSDKPPQPLWYALADFNLRLEFGPLDFIQVNQDMNQRMISQAIKLLYSLKGKKVLDLFCGIGNFSLPLATLAESVTGIELEQSMVQKAQANAVLNGIENVEFLAADLSDPGKLPVWHSGIKAFDVVVLDPPRTGALEVLPQVAATGAPQILYISCHTGSLARDAAILVNDYGYRLKSAGAMDMFPQTSHVEAMALFER
ncbi:MAG: 23S rRNA (uracil(1939)-C(5))-methyltransferase RlmD [Gammaproteobacteria bacterium]|nr:23S rRNA (uracil(1939)-C(5))-methyltransferase RlmD [Gammaproteobacteria bacterium]MCP4088785.1 23S rRNA (uracil(1939)-C(5))-methyltransferase RlmD [Gammaproteobacteria bacterium]MCP4928267.1 23S rRNA (uracil(1939)-C(5))-methyltransferase RlmD [Gammaproteobacteria bacterium]